MSGEIDLAGSGGASGSPNPGTPAARLGGGGGGDGNLNLLKEMTLRGLHERVEKKEEQILKIEATVFQVSNYNLVFQGMILAAITNGGSSSSSTCSSSAFRCDLSFLPMCLSAVGSILNFAVLWTNAAKYMDALEQLDRRNLTLYKNQHPTALSTAKDIEKRHGRSKERRMLILTLIGACVKFCNSMPTITVKNSTVERLRMVDRYVIDSELNLTYEGTLSRWIPQGETRVIDYTRFVTESVQHMRPQIISVVVAGGGPEEILRHSDFSDGGSFEFMMEADVERGPRRLVHTFDAGNGGGEMTVFRRIIWNIIMRGAAFLS